MATENTEVVTGKLEQTAGSLRDLIAAYRTALDRYYSCGTELGTMLDGDQSRKFLFTLTNDREKFDALTRLLQQYVEALEQVATVYTKTNSDILDVLSKKGIH